MPILLIIQELEAITLIK